MVEPVNKEVDVAASRPSRLTHINVLLFACDPDNRLDECGLAKVKHAPVLQDISWHVLPWQMVVATIDGFEHLPKTVRAIMLIWEHRTTHEQESHVVVKCECLKERAQLLKCPEVGRHKRASG